MWQVIKRLDVPYLLVKAACSSPLANGVWADLCERAQRKAGAEEGGDLTGTAARVSRGLCTHIGHILKKNSFCIVELHECPL